MVTSAMFHLPKASDVAYLRFKGWKIDSSTRWKKVPSHIAEGLGGK